MEFLKALWINTVAVLMLLTFMLFPFVPVLAVAMFSLNPCFMLLMLPFAIVDFTFFSCYATKIDNFCEKHNIFSE